MAVAVLGASLVEGHLEQLLLQRFKTRDAALVEQVFQNRGPLSDFHSKILIARAFGIITYRMAEELHSIKAIRNTFAHAKVSISFDHEPLHKEILTLKTLAAAQEAAGGSLLPKSNKGRFLLAIQFYISVLDLIRGDDQGTAYEILGRAIGKLERPEDNKNPKKEK